ncbi:hypothetical protein MLPF_0540 [Mycobacterium lepromatosis]|nr:hypothetical protein MLPF_0540 [Mycobacterium lepromatosis]
MLAREFSLILMPAMYPVSAPRPINGAHDVTNFSQWGAALGMVTCAIGGWLNVSR